MKIIVASTNPVKIGATLSAFQIMLPDIEFEIEGVSGPSGVSDMPMSDSETYQGALNRCNRIKEKHEQADYWVGIEGGIDKNTASNFDAFAWIVIQSKTQISQSRSATFSLPPKVIALIKQGHELGEADDIVFGQSNTKQKSGAVGLLTHNVIDRTTLYEHMTTLALIPFKNPDLYSEKTPQDIKTG